MISEYFNRSIAKTLEEGRQALNEETAYDSGAIISDKDEGSVGDFQVYKIPVQFSSCPSSTDAKGVYVKLEITFSGHCVQLG